MGIGIVLAQKIVTVSGDGFMRSQFFQPFFVIRMEPGFVVIDENGSGDMHGVAKQQAFLDAGILQGLPDLLGDVDKGASAGQLEYKFLSVAFHVAAPLIVYCLCRKFNLELQKVKFIFQEMTKSSFFLVCRLESRPFYGKVSCNETKEGIIWTEKC